MNFKWLLSGVFTFFIAVLVVCYVISKQANPVFLDEHGKPVATAKTGY